MVDNLFRLDFLPGRLSTSIGMISLMPCGIGFGARAQQAWAERGL